ncbi:uncharacterized protein LOC115895257 [Rhinopithecus roxellana]|uniref:uncharacterized protein LOC115895257 n=1 Tax=Rhinopithecus roxellana TaxID=61622 RepID=UPI001237263E|nr:uncharacterized protein LOC115895257 [Rhinopithecus roxellana]
MVMVAVTTHLPGPHPLSKALPPVPLSWARPCQPPLCATHLSPPSLCCLFLLGCSSWSGFCPLSSSFWGFASSSVIHALRLGFPWPSPFTLLSLLSLCPGPSLHSQPVPHPCFARTSLLAPSLPSLGTPFLSPALALLPLCPRASILSLRLLCRVCFCMNFPRSVFTVGPHGRLFGSGPDTFSVLQNHLEKKRTGYLHLNVQQVPSPIISRADLVVPSYPASVSLSEEKCLLSSQSLKAESWWSSPSHRVLFLSRLQWLSAPFSTYPLFGVSPPPSHLDLVLLGLFRFSALASLSGSMSFPHIFHTVARRICQRNNCDNDREYASGCVPGALH